MIIFGQCFQDVILQKVLCAGWAEDAHSVLSPRVILAGVGEVSGTWPDQETQRTPPPRSTEPALWRPLIYRLDETLK